MQPTAVASSTALASTEAIYTTQDGRRIRIDPFWQCAAANFEMDWARHTAKIIRDDLQRAHTPYNHSNSAFAAYAPVFLNHIAAYALEEQLRWNGYILHPFDTGKNVTQHETNLLTLLHPDQDFAPPQTAQDQIELTTFQLEQMFQAGMSVLRQEATEHVRDIIKEDAPFLLHTDVPAIRLFMEIASDVEDAGLVAMSQMVGQTPLCPALLEPEAHDSLKQTYNSLCKLFAARMEAPQQPLPSAAKPLYQGYLCLGLKSLTDAFSKMANPTKKDHTLLAGTILSGQGLVQTTPRADLTAPRDEGPVASYCGELLVVTTTLAQHVATGAFDSDARLFTQKRTGKPFPSCRLSPHELSVTRGAAHQVFLEASALVGHTVDHLSGYRQNKPILLHEQRARFIQ